MKRILGALAAGGLLAGVGLATGGPAMAAGCNGAACAVDGAVSVSASITLAMPVTSFNDGSLTAGQDSGIKTGNLGANGGGQLSATVVSGDSHGYAVTVSPVADWTAGNGNTFPASALGIWRHPDLSMVFNGTIWNSATEVQTPAPGATPAILDSSAGVSAAGGDSYYYATEVIPPASAGAGAYSIALNFVALGN